MYNNNHVEIVSGKQGCHLKVNSLFIRHEFKNFFMAISCSTGVPYNATEWVSIKALRDFWNEYRCEIIFSTEFPYENFGNGYLQAIQKIG